MALLEDKINVTLEELEENLGEKKLPEFIRRSEEGFIAQIDRIVDIMNEDRSRKAIFVAGPTSSGKTTFTMRLASGLSKAGRSAAFLSLDDYYCLTDLQFDRDGRPDFETIDAIDVKRAEAAEEKARKMLDDKAHMTSVEQRLAEARLKRALVRKSVASSTNTH